MAKINGTNVAAKIVPFTTDDQFATHEAQYGKGGWREVATIQDRNAITEDRREAGMAVYVLETNGVYILDDDLTTWNQLESGKVDDVQVNGTSVVENKIANVSVPTKVSDLTNDSNFQTGTQVSNTVSGAINTHNTSNNAHNNLLTPITQDITAIEEKIPAEASSSNQLTDKAYVDGKIGDVNEWTTEQYTATTTNFVVGNTYTVEEAFQRTASLFAGQQGEIDDIEEVIPAQATAQNQLADKSFVNATVATNSANFRGNWATWADVPTEANLYPEDYVGNRTPTNNDYMVVSDASQFIPVGDLMHRLTVENLHPTEAFTLRITDENGVSKKYYYEPYSRQYVAIDDYYSLRYDPGIPGIWYIKTNDDRPIIIKGTTYSSGQAQLCTTNDPATPFYAGVSPQAGEYQGSWRFIYVGTWETNGKTGWNPVYQIGTAFTQEQQAAIDSGITSNMVDNYVNPTSTAATAYNARITSLETDKRDIINSANKVYATDANGANKNDLAYDKTATADTIAQRGTNGVLKVGTPVDNADATTKLYVDTIASAKQDTLTEGTNITIRNNVISSTSQETFFRGRFEDWVNVPTDPSLYQANFRGETTPCNSDYMVVDNASGYVNPDFAKDLDNIAIRKSLQDQPYGIDITIGETTTHYTYTAFSNWTPLTASGWISIRYEAGSPGRYFVKTNVTYYVDNERHNENTQTEVMVTNQSLETVHYISKNPGVAPIPLRGGWNFGYFGTWAEDGKNGWKPQYQVEDVLPIASSTEQGIARLYNTTGQNRDGSMTQKSITDALDTKANTSDLATVATTGSYNDLSDTPTIPTVNDSTITLTQGGTTKGTFTLNQSSGTTINFDIGQEIQVDASTMPDASTCPGRIVQWVGDTSSMTGLTKGYFYISGTHMVYRATITAEDWTPSYTSIIADFFVHKFKDVIGRNPAFDEDLETIYFLYDGSNWDLVDVYFGRTTTINDVTLSEYGVTVTGTPTNGSKLNIVPTVDFVSTWNRLNVQPDNGATVVYDAINEELTIS